MATRTVETWQNGKLIATDTQTVPDEIVNAEALLSKAAQALSGNGAYLGHAAVPAGAALTATQLTTAVRLLVAQVDALTRQINALIRLQVQQLGDVSDT